MNNNSQEFHPGIPNKRKKIFIIIGVILTIIISLVAWGLLALRNIQTLTEINLGSYQIPTIYNIVGERRITSFNREITRSGGITTRTVTLTYERGAIDIDDIEKYIDALVEHHGFTVCSRYIRVSKESETTSQTIYIDFVFNPNGNTVIIYYNEPTR